MGRRPLRGRAEQNAIETTRRVYEAVVATINQTPQGAPGGALYAALMPYLSLDQFQIMMDSLVYAKRVRRESLPPAGMGGEVYFPCASREETS